MSNLKFSKHEIEIVYTALDRLLESAKGGNVPIETAAPTEESTATANEIQALRWRFERVMIRLDRREQRRFGGER